MTDLKKFVIDTTTQRLKDLGYDVPSSLESYVDEVELSINNYCNTSSVAEDLKFVWVNMLVDYLRWVVRIAASKGNTSSPGSSSTPTILTSLKEGDTTLGFSADTAGKASQEASAHKVASSLDQVVMNYADALNKHRRVVW